MSSDNLSKFITNIYLYLVENGNVPGLLVKKHTGNFKEQGDMSFPNNIKCWKEYISCQLNKSEGDFLKCVNKNVDLLMENSQAWVIPISKCLQMNNRVHIFLNRPIAIQVGFIEACKNNLYILKQISENSSLARVDYTSPNLSSITELRCKYLAIAVQNLSAVYSLLALNILVSSKPPPADFNGKTVFVGTVLNAKTGTKENTIQPEEFIRIRQDELTLIAQHKYGVRVSIDDKWREFISQLGQSAAIFELLQTKASSPVKVHFDASGSSSKGAAFILYNCARLETLLRTFNEKVKDGGYPPLPELGDTDLSLLTHEEEWCLIYVYIMGLPSMLKNSVEVNEEKCEFRPHLICNHLTSMVKVFSQYYRRVRILTEPRKHLLPVMYARIHMVKILNDTLKTCLRVLNIKSVSQMYVFV